MVAQSALPAAMRAAGVEAFRYVSARDSEGGQNLALFSPRAFAKRRPETPESWMCSATRARVEFQRKDYFDRTAWAFERRSFLVGGRLPQPAVGSLPQAKRGDARTGGLRRGARGSGRIALRGIGIAPNVAREYTAGPNREWTEYFRAGVGNRPWISFL